METARDTSERKIELPFDEIAQLSAENAPTVSAVDDPDTQRIPEVHITWTVAGDVRGGGTGAEFVENLSNDGTEAWNKWYHPWAGNSSIVAQLSEVHELQGYGICSANDCPHRDPIEWTLYGLGSDGSWTVLHHMPEVAGESPFDEHRRWQWRWFRFAEPVAVRSVRLELHAVRQRIDGVQLGHWHLLAEPPISRSAIAPTSLRVQPVDTLPDGMWRIPANHITLSAAGDVRGGGTGREFVQNLLNDGTEGWNKWYHCPTNSSWVMAQLCEEHELHGYGVCSANDCPHRDPMEWTLLGQGLNGSWVVLHHIPEVAGESPFDERRRWEWRWFMFSQPVVVRSVRLHIHSVRQHAHDGVQLGHWHLLTEPPSSPKSAMGGVRR
jgi:hypothetical protein